LQRSQQDQEFQIAEARAKACLLSDHVGPCSEI
jgi:hypothetical protein